MNKAERKGARDGFTLVEAVVATTLAAMGFALIFQGLGGAARLMDASRQSARAVLVARSVLAEAVRTAQEGREGSQEGITNGIAWTLTSSVMTERQDGVRLVRYDVLAEGSSGRQVHLASARTFPAANGETP